MGIKSNLDEARAEKKKVAEAYGKLMDERKTAMAGMGDIFEQRDALNKQIKEKVTEIKALRDERREKADAWNAYITEQKERRAAKERDEREAREKEEEKKRLEDEIEKDKEMPFIAEIELVENSINYCEQLLAAGKGQEEEKQEAKAAPKALDGTSVLVAKKDRDVEFFYAPTAKKKGKKAKSAVAKADAPYTHSLDTLSLFADMKIDAPRCLADVPKTLESLKTKHVDYKKKQETEWASRKKKREAREKALAELNA